MNFTAVELWDGSTSLQSRTVIAPVHAASVLIVEDEPALRELYRRALTAARYRATVAEDGLTALAMLEQGNVDVVVLDLELPRVSGWDVYHEIRSRRRMNKLPIIIVTGNDLKEIDVRDLAAFLPKPVDPFQLVAAVDAALNA